VKDENYDLKFPQHLCRWKNYFPQLLNLHRINDELQIETCSAELLISDCSLFEVEIATVKLERYKLPGNDQILAELIQGGGWNGQGM
jgi:hypothetical protein